MKTESINRTLEGLFIDVDFCNAEDYKRIDTLVVSRTDFDGSIMEVDYKDLLNFPNLFNLTLDSCMIDNELIEILSSLSNLRRLTLINCEVLENIKDSFNRLNLYDLFLLNINFDLSILTKDYKNIRIESVPFKYFSGHCGTLNVYGCEINDIDELFNINYDEVIISNEMYLTNQLKFDDSSKKTIVMEENGQYVLKEVGSHG